MKVQQISLAERLERLSKGYPSDPDFITSAIRSFADIPICTYLYECPEELKALTQIIGATKDEMARLTYKDVASRIHIISLAPRRSRAAHRAIAILSLPLRKYHDMKGFIYGGG